jgi:hypothetical protein
MPDTNSETSMKRYRHIQDVYSVGSEDRLVIGSGLEKYAVVTNLENSAILTVLSGTKILLARKRISDSKVSSDFLVYLVEQFRLSSKETIEFLESATEEEIEGHRLMFSLGGKNEPKNKF